MKKVALFVFLLSVVLLLSSGVGCGNTYQEEVETIMSPSVEEEIFVARAPIYEEVEIMTTMPFKAFPVYTDKRSPDNHFIPSGWMGDIGDIVMDDACMQNPHSGSTCIKFTYGAKGGTCDYQSRSQRWAGVYWQNPPNNWGDKDGGFDLTGAERLTFWARGEEGGERIEEFKVGGITGRYSDSDTAGIGPVALTPDWKQYTIDLSDKDLSYVSGGFCWATNIDVNPDGCIFYLDDIKYE